MMQDPLDTIEIFLLRLERDEAYIFEFCPDYFIFPVFPFFQLVYLSNLEQVILDIQEMCSEFNIMLARVDGYLNIAISEKDFDEIKLRERLIQILRNMRF